MLKDKKNQQDYYEETEEYVEDSINYDYDWNTEYGDGDIPDIDK